MKTFSSHEAKRIETRIRALIKLGIQPAPHHEELVTQWETYLKENYPKNTSRVLAQATGLSHETLLQDLKFFKIEVRNIGGGGRAPRKNLQFKCPNNHYFFSKRKRGLTHCPTCHVLMNRQINLDSRKAALKAQGLTVQDSPVEFLAQWKEWLTASYSQHTLPYIERITAIPYKDLLQDLITFNIPRHPRLWQSPAGRSPKRSFTHKCIMGHSYTCQIRSGLKRCPVCGVKKEIKHDPENLIRQ
jgi:hypothetical protein